VKKAETCQSRNINSFFSADTLLKARLDRAAAKLMERKVKLKQYLLGSFKTPNEA